LVFRFFNTTNEPTRGVRSLLGNTMPLSEACFAAAGRGGNNARTESSLIWKFQPNGNACHGSGLSRHPGRLRLRNRNGR
jgi:hypothetical protein